MRKLTNKKILAIAVLAAVLCAGLIFNACGKLDSDENVYTITFFAEYPVPVLKTTTMGEVLLDGDNNPVRVADENGFPIWDRGDPREFEYWVEEMVSYYGYDDSFNSLGQPIKIPKGLKIRTDGNGKLPSFPSNPVRPGDWSFAGWYTIGGTQVYRNTIFTTNTLVQARWKANSINILDGPVALAFDPIEAALKGSSPEDEYLVEFDADEDFKPRTLEFGGNKNVRIILQGTVLPSGSDLITAELNLSESGSMFTVGRNVTLVLRDVHMRGNERNTKALITVNEGGTLIIGEDANDDTLITINGAEDERSGGGVTVNKGGHLIMNGGRIFKCNSLAYRDEDYYGQPGGAGVYVRGGTFDMYNGMIEDCFARYNGGGVHADLGGIFTMYGGTLYNNAAPYGGGAATYRGGLFIMKPGALIRGNLAVYGSGVFADHGSSEVESAEPYDPRRPVNYVGMPYDPYGDYDPLQLTNDIRKKEGFYMEGGEIRENTSLNVGGAICNYQGGLVYMTGGTLIDNHADDYGAGVYNMGLFIMIDGIIQANKGYLGGGVFVAETGMFIMEKGIIGHPTDYRLGNEGTAGGGVFVVGQFAMHGGAISYNVASYGAGVTIYPTANAFAMSGGVINNNRGRPGYASQGEAFYFMNIDDPYECGLAYYGKRAPGEAADSGFMSVQPWGGYTTDKDGANTFVLKSPLVPYTANASGALIPNDWPLSSSTSSYITVRDGRLYTSNAGGAQPVAFQFVGQYDGQLWDGQVFNPIVTDPMHPNDPGFPRN